MARLRLRKLSDSACAIQGTARVDRRTKDMIPRLQSGDIAVINHRDLDRVAADGLIEAGVVAVVNCAPSISGRYPNGGPIRVVNAGIVLVDGVGVECMDRVQEGDVVRLEHGEVWRTVPPSRPEPSRHRIEHRCAGRRGSHGTVAFGPIRVESTPEKHPRKAPEEKEQRSWRSTSS